MFDQRRLRALWMWFSSDFGQENPTYLPQFNLDLLRFTKERRRSRKKTVGLIFTAQPQKAPVPLSYVFKTLFSCFLVDISHHYHHYYHHTITTTITITTIITTSCLCCITKVTKVDGCVPLLVQSCFITLVCPFPTSFSLSNTTTSDIGQPSIHYGGYV